MSSFRFTILTTIWNHDPEGLYAQIDDCRAHDPLIPQSVDNI